MTVGADGLVARAACSTIAGCGVAIGTITARNAGCGIVNQDEFIDRAGLAGSIAKELSGAHCENAPFMARRRKMISAVDENFIFILNLFQYCCKFHSYHSFSISNCN